MVHARSVRCARLKFKIGLEKRLSYNVIQGSQLSVGGVLKK